MIQRQCSDDMYVYSNYFADDIAASTLAASAVLFEKSFSRLLGSLLSATQPPSDIPDLSCSYTSVDFPIGEVNDPGDLLELKLLSE